MAFQFTLVLKKMTVQAITKSSLPLPCHPLSTPLLVVLIIGYLGHLFAAAPLSYRLTDQDETLREKGRSVSTLQVRAKYLEDENSRLLDRMELVNQQKLGIDKVIKGFNLGKDREVLYSLLLTYGSFRLVLDLILCM